MNTSAEAVRLLQSALSNTQDAVRVINDLIVEHDYQDVAVLVSQAAAVVLESATALMQGQPETALDALEKADDLFDAVYAIIDSETDEDE